MFSTLIFQRHLIPSPTTNDKLLIKLQNIGVDTKMRNIIKDFLSDRTFQVKVGDILSVVGSQTCFIWHHPGLGDWTLAFPHFH